MKHFFYLMFLVCAFAITCPEFISGAYSQEISPQTAVIDFKEASAYLKLNPEIAEVSGSVTYIFDVLTTVDTLKLDARNFSKASASLNGKSVDIVKTASALKIPYPFSPSQRNILQVDYETAPQSAIYFVNNQGSPQLWTQGQGKYTSHWLPSIDDMNDKMTFDFKIESPSKYTVIANGTLLSKSVEEDNTVWEYDMSQPMSSYLTAIVVGEYNKTVEAATSGVSLEHYYYPQDAEKVEPTYRYTKQIFDFLETEIGIPYPWKIYKQAPVKDFLYAGMENTSLTIFSDSFMVDNIGFNDRNYVNVNAHELAHQWFGDLVTETRSEHHWLHEGFATYYALLAEREIFGDDYFYFKLYQTAEQLKELSDAGKGQKLVATGGSSLTYYQKGAWALHILREKVGEDAFAKAIKAYLLKHAYKNVTTEDFMSEVASASEIDLSNFTKNWLYQSAFQAEEALESLKKSDFMRQYFELQALRGVPFSEKKEALEENLAQDNEYLGQEVVYQLASEPVQETLPLYFQAFDLNNIYIDQAIAESVAPEKIERNLKALFLKMQADVSYETREMVLYKLWAMHDGVLTQEKLDARKKVLDDFDGSFGFSDGNIRLLWLALSFATPDYRAETLNKRIDELTGYTHPSNPFQLRENAFRYALQLDVVNETVLKNLVEASVHHTWRFRESARKMLAQFLENEKYKSQVIQLKEALPENQKAYLKRIGL
ncbi:M1 family peptidase [Dokdonia sinensis]|uniref:Aminopeptidase N n=1 Tax=Dokdonia sinensis TaxID=2479847 RepID=A0A3M0GFW9_9FLAO|nr:M1 family metallopeptidase [Dokdonia sinensis]RMB60503.1 M1 family peptidase [Dokdonia sinensis]